MDRAMARELMIEEAAALGEEPLEPFGRQHGRRLPPERMDQEDRKTPINHIIGSRMNSLLL